MYIGQRNNLHLYGQGIIVTCDSVGSLLKQDSSFINVLPLVAEEKISYEIYSNSGLYYIDSVNLIFGAGVDLNRPLIEADYNFIQNCVDSIDTIGNICHVYGTRDQMLCIAAYNFVNQVFDLKKEGPVNIKKNPQIDLKNSNVQKNSSRAINLNGQIGSIKKQSNDVRILNGKLVIQQNSH